MTALLLLAPGHAAAVPGAGVRAPRARSSTSPTTSRSWRRRCAAGRASSSRSSRAWRGRGCRQRLPDPARSADVRALQARPRRARARTREAYALHRDLLALRREDPVFRAQRSGGVDGAVLGAAAFVLRFFGDGPIRRPAALLVNLGADLHLAAVAEPLLAPPRGMRWDVLWSSEADPLRRRRHAAELETRRRLASCRADTRRASWAAPRDGTERDAAAIRRVAYGRWATPTRGRSADARVAGHQRPRRLRVGHGRRRGHAPLPRPADRRAAGAARPHGDAEPPARAARLPDGDVAARRGEERDRGRQARGRRSASGRVPPGDGPAGLAVRAWTASSLEKRVLMPHRQNTVHVSYRLRLGPGAGPAAGCGPPSTSALTNAPVSEPLAGPYGLTVRGRPLRAVRRAPALPRLRLRTHGAPAAFTRLGSARIAACPVPRRRRSRGYESPGDLWSPGYFRVTLEPEGDEAR